ncbi:hypothetical protein CDZ97_17520 [Mameliella alba]|nr:hypothetical protein CDZ97_17520 [Mameliella alba]
MGTDADTAGTMITQAIGSLRRTADLAHCLGDRRTLSLQNFNLPKLGHYLFGLFSLSSHR